MVVILILVIILINMSICQVNFVLLDCRQQNILLISGNVHTFVKVKAMFLTTPWRHIGGLEVELHSFFTSELDRCEWWTSHPDCLTPWERAWVPTEQVAEWAPCQSGDLVKWKLPCWNGTPDHLAHSLVTTVTVLASEDVTGINIC